MVLVNKKFDFYKGEFSTRGFCTYEIFRLRTGERDKNLRFLFFEKEPDTSDLPKFLAAFYMLQSLKNLDRMKPRRFYTALAAIMAYEKVMGVDDLTKIDPELFDRLWIPRSCIPNEYKSDVELYNFYLRKNGVVSSFEANISQFIILTERALKHPNKSFAVFLILFHYWFYFKYLIRLYIECYIFCMKPYPLVSVSLNHERYLIKYCFVFFSINGGELLKYNIGGESGIELRLLRIVSVIAKLSNVRYDLI